MNERIPSGHLQRMDWTLVSTPNPYFYSLKTTDAILNLRVLATPIISQKMPQSYRYGRQQKTRVQGSTEMHPFLTDGMVVESVASLA